MKKAFRNLFSRSFDIKAERFGLLVFVIATAICLHSLVPSSSQLNAVSGFENITGRERGDNYGLSLIEDIEPPLAAELREDELLILPEAVVMTDIPVNSGDSQLTFSDGKEPIFFGSTGVHKPMLEEVGGEMAWVVDPKSDRLYMIIDANDQEIGTGVANIAVTVSYYDGEGMFTIQNYKQNRTRLMDNIKTNSMGNIFAVDEAIQVSIDVVSAGTETSINQTEVVVLGNTGEWKEYTFELNSIVLNNSIMGGDLWVATYIASEGWVSDSPIYIRDVVVEIMDISETDIVLGENVLCVIKDKNNEEIERNLVTFSDVSSKLSLLEFSIEESGIYSVEITPISEDARDIKVSETIVIPLTVIEDTSSVSNLMGINIRWGKGWGESVAYKEKSSLITAAGFGWARGEMEWSLAESEKGVIEILPIWDEYVDALVSEGIEPLILLNYGNNFYDEGGAPYTDEGVEAYINYAKAIVSHFEGRVSHYEIWNEYNLEGTAFNPTSRPPQDYARMLEATYTAIKEINPDIQVIGGAMAGADINWLSTILKSGAGSYMDALSLHPYCYPQDPESGHVVEALTYLTNALNQMGLDLPLWITEIGWPTHEGAYGVSEIVSGDNLIKSFVQLTALPGVERIFWYSFEDSASNRTNPEANFGLLKSWHDENASSAKANYISSTVLARFWADAVFVSTYRTNNIIVHQYKADGQDLLVVWTKFGNDLLNLGVGTAMLTDSQFNQKSINLASGIPVSVSPVFIVGDGLLR